MKSTNANKKKLVASLVAGASILMSLGSITQALAQSLVLQIPAAKLLPSDLAAQLSPNLVNVPVVAQPALKIGTNNTVSAESYDLATRAVVIGNLPIALPPSTNPTIPNITRIAPNFGVKGIVTSESEVSKESIIGADNRVKINNTTTYPWRAMTKLFVTYSNGARGGCSGTLIAAKYVLTAGHCVHNRGNGGWATRVEVVPGLNGSYKPYGSAFATRLRSNTGWTQNQDSNHDYALITLDRPIGNTTGWLGYGYYSSVNGVNSHIAGYPGDKDGGLGLYYHYGLITGSTAQRVSYQIDTFSGQSGSGVYRISNGSRFVFAVHTNGGVTSNSGTRIDSSKFNTIKGWIATGN